MKESYVIILCSFKLSWLGRINRRNWENRTGRTMSERLREKEILRVRKYNAKN